MFYKIEPVDTLFFRDGKPFTMGSESWANPIFPQFPSTIYGAIRSWLIFQKANLKDFLNGKLKEELGTPDTKGTLKIKGPLICDTTTPLFPIPKDMLKDKEETQNKLFKLTMDIPIKYIILSDYKLEKWFINKSDKFLDETQGFITLPDLKDYLEQKYNNICFFENSQIYLKETKIGIKRNRKTLTTEEGYLYKIPLIRLKEEKGLVVKIEGIKELPEEGVLQLGGERKLAKIKKIENPLKEIENINFELKNNHFKIYLATPAIFEKGWIPSWIDQNSEFKGEYKGIKLQLVAAITGKPVFTGGWDIARKKPKNMYKAIPAGSIYVFKTLNNTSPEKIKQTFHLQNISDINPEEGFGLSIIGEV